MIISINDTCGVGGQVDDLAGTAGPDASSPPLGPCVCRLHAEPLLVDLPVESLSDWAAWREIVAATGLAHARQTGQVVIAARTVLNEQYIRRIRAGFDAAGD